jgi:3-hydroxyacyl-CoA dehydrogenase
VNDIIVAESARKGIQRRTVDAEEIVSRLLGAMVVEGARVVREGTARHIDDVDVAVVNGFGFPRFAGGPMWWAQQQDPSIRASLASAVAAAAREDVATAIFDDVLRDA